MKTQPDRLSELRLAMKNVDNEILQIFMRRMYIVKEIGRYKRGNNITILQIDRCEELLNNYVNRGAAMGMSADFVKKMYLLIHDESIRIQTKIMNSTDGF